MESPQRIIISTKVHVLEVPQQVVDCFTLKWSLCCCVSIQGTNPTQPPRYSTVVNFVSNKVTVQISTQFLGLNLPICVNELARALYFRVLTAVQFRPECGSSHTSRSPLLKPITHRSTVFKSTVWFPLTSSKHQWISMCAMYKFSITPYLFTHFHVRRHFTRLSLSFC